MLIPATLAIAPTISAADNRPASPSALAPAAASVRFDTSDREAVENAYFANWLPHAILKPEWTGNVKSCDPGTVSEEFQDGTEQSLNFVRALAALDPIVLDPDLSARASKAALIMDATGLLNHYPATSDRCYTSAGAAAAARSNLLLDDYLTASGIAEQYMDDPGSTNRRVGHRRWILNPVTTTMGSGTTNTANALTVVDVGKNPAARNPGYIPWPSAGYFPGDLEPHGRWSLSVPEDVDVAAATVAVKGPEGTPAAVTAYQPQSGYGADTLVWELGAAIELDGKTDQTYTVTVSGLRDWNRTRLPNYSYQVALFSPHRPFAAGKAPTIVGSGPFRVTDKLALTPGTWLPAGHSLDEDIQWYRDDQPLRGENMRMYYPEEKDVGHHITATVKPALLNPTQPYPPTEDLAHTLDFGVILPEDHTGWQLEMSRRPTLIGTPRVGKSLTVRATGTWQPRDEAVMVAYRWFARGRLLKAATNRTLVIRQSMLGKRIRVKMTGSATGLRSRTYTLTTRIPVQRRNP
ncbi:CAP domain-containing protein [Nocardioides sp. GY 10113]|uniref:CAP domain-containing protein n=1 Tax=Nocardioides sp. GY 10113 TaxID=2569761 RepID=UPI0014582540|nr:CAP domain-containing protein [Nocardioides sp. GY 10113]